MSDGVLFVIEFVEVGGLVGIINDGFARATAGSGVVVVHFLASKKFLEEEESFLLVILLFL